ncbi:hypothetical protein GCM10028807_13780 [Spirosoma daeguense]
MLTDIIHSTTGTIHFTSAMAAIILGTCVVLMPKGTRAHRQIGYGYVVSMILVNLTAFMIYRLFGKFGPFHIAALFSSITIIGGMVPIIFRRYVPSWFYYHYYFMNWSVIGLYAAFWAETLVRLFPMKQFWPVVVVATGLTTFLGSYLVNRYKLKFFEAFAPKSKSLN